MQRCLPSTSNCYQRFFYFAVAVGFDFCVAVVVVVVAVVVEGKVFTTR